MIIREKDKWVAVAAVFGGVVFCAAVLALILNRGDEDPIQTAASAGAKSTTTKPATSLATTSPSGASESTNAAAAPRITLTVNDSREASVIRGWPAVVDVALIHPAELSRSRANESISIKGQNGGAWPTSIRLSIRDERGAAVDWPLQPAGSAPADVSLSRGNQAVAEWVLSPQQTAALPEGNYELVAELDAPDGVRAGPSVPVDVTVVQPPPTLDARQQAEMHLTTADYHFARGDVPAAGASLDQLLAQQPAHVTALARRAELLATQNRFDEAMDFCSKAIDAHLASAQGNEPPHGLLMLQRDLLDAAHKD